MTMKRSLFAAVALAAVAFASATRDMVSESWRTVRIMAAAARDWLFDLALAPLKLAQPKVGEVADARPRVMLVKASAFVERLMQRRRPQIETRWRMCPST